jgi:hypothetical protein
MFLGRERKRERKREREFVRSTLLLIRNGRSEHGCMEISARSPKKQAPRKMKRVHYCGIQFPDRAT